MSLIVLLPEDVVEFSAQITPTSGFYSVVKTVTMATSVVDPAYVIYYTLDGTDPTPASLLYTAPFTVSVPTTVKAIAYDTIEQVYQGSMITRVYDIDLIAMVTTASVPGGSYNTDQTVYLTTSEPAAGTYYTLDGSTPTVASTLYTSAGIFIDHVCTLRFFSMDMTGHKEGAQNIEYIVDKVMPVTSINIVDGQRYPINKSVVITVVDEPGAVLVTKYSLDYGNTWSVYDPDPTYGTRLTINTNPYTIQFYTSDSTGHIEAVQQVAVTIAPSFKETWAYASHPDMRWNFKKTIVDSYKLVFNGGGQYSEDSGYNIVRLTGELVGFPTYISKDELGTLTWTLVYNGANPGPDIIIYSNGVEVARGKLNITPLGWTTLTHNTIPQVKFKMQRSSYLNNMGFWVGNSYYPTHVINLESSVDYNFLTYYNFVGGSGTNAIGTCSVVDRTFYWDGSTELMYGDDLWVPHQVYSIELADKWYSYEGYMYFDVWKWVTQISAGGLLRSPFKIYIDDVLALTFTGVQSYGYFWLSFNPQTGISFYDYIGNHTCVMPQIQYPGMSPQYWASENPIPVPVSAGFHTIRMEAICTDTSRGQSDAYTYMVRFPLGITLPVADLPDTVIQCTHQGGLYKEAQTLNFIPSQNGVLIDPKKAYVEYMHNNDGVWHPYTEFVTGEDCYSTLKRINPPEVLEIPYRLMYTYRDWQLTDNGAYQVGYNVRYWDRTQPLPTSPLTSVYRYTYDGSVYYTYIPGDPMPVGNVTEWQKKYSSTDLYWLSHNEAAGFPINEMKWRGTSVSYTSTTWGEYTYVTDHNWRPTTVIDFRGIDFWGRTLQAQSKTFTVDKFITDTVLPVVYVNTQDGTYDNAFEFYAWASKKGDIYYTTDGTDPTILSPKVVGSFWVYDTTTYKFKAVDLSGNESVMVTLSIVLVDTKSDKIRVFPPAGWYKTIMPENVRFFGGNPSVTYEYTMDNWITSDTVGPNVYVPLTSLPMQYPVVKVKEIDQAGNISGVTTLTYNELDITPPTFSVAMRVKQYRMQVWPSHARGALYSHRTELGAPDLVWITTNYVNPQDIPTINLCGGLIEDLGEQNVDITNIGAFYSDVEVSLNFTLSEIGTIFYDLNNYSYNGVPNIVVSNPSDFRIQPSSSYRTYRFRVIDRANNVSAIWTLQVSPTTAMPTQVAKTYNSYNGMATYYPGGRYSNFAVDYYTVKSMPVYLYMTIDGSEPHYSNPNAMLVLEYPAFFRPVYVRVRAFLANGYAFPERDFDLTVDDKKCYITLLFNRLDGFMSQEDELIVEARKTEVLWIGDYDNPVTTGGLVSARNIYASYAFDLTGQTTTDPLYTTLYKFTPYNSNYFYDESCEAFYEAMPSQGQGYQMYTAWVMSPPERNTPITMYYTLDGSDPDASPTRQVYTGSLQFPLGSGRVQVKMIAIDETNGTRSNEVMQWYDLPLLFEGFKTDPTPRGWILTQTSCSVSYGSGYLALSGSGYSSSVATITSPPMDCTGFGIIKLLLEIKNVTINDYCKVECKSAEHPSWELVGGFAASFSEWQTIPGNPDQKFIGLDISNFANGRTDVQVKLSLAGIDTLQLLGLTLVDSPTVLPTIPLELRLSVPWNSSTLAAMVGTFSIRNGIIKPGVINTDNITITDSHGNSLTPNITYDSSTQSGTVTAAWSYGGVYSLSFGEGIADEFGRAIEPYASTMNAPPLPTAVSQLTVYMSSPNQYIQYGYADIKVYDEKGEKVELGIPELDDDDSSTVHRESSVNHYFNPPKVLSAVVVSAPGLRIPEMGSSIGYTSPNTFKVYAWRSMGNQETTISSYKGDNVAVPLLADTTPFGVNSIVPNYGVRSLDPSSPIEIEFTKFLGYGTITSANISVVQKGSVTYTVDTRLFYEGRTKTVKIYPSMIVNGVQVDTVWKSGAEYTVTVTEGLTDFWGNILLGGFVSVVETILGDEEAPTCSIQPESGVYTTEQAVVISSNEGEGVVKTLTRTIVKEAPVALTITMY